MTPIRTRIAMAALAATTAITTTTAAVTGVAAHRADDRADLLAVELKEERAARDADFKAIAALEGSSDALRASVDLDPDAGRYLLVGSERGTPTDTEAMRMPVSDERWAEPWARYSFHACPAGETVGPEDAEKLSRLGVEIYGPGDVLPGVEELDHFGFALPHIIDVTGVRCVPAE